MGWRRAITLDGDFTAVATVVHPTTGDLVNFPVPEGHSWLSIDPDFGRLFTKERTLLDGNETTVVTAFDIATGSELWEVNFTTSANLADQVGQPHVLPGGDVIISYRAVEGSYTSTYYYGNWYHYWDITLDESQTKRISPDGTEQWSTTAKGIVSNIQRDIGVIVDGMRSSPTITAVDLANGEIFEGTTSWSGSAWPSFDADREVWITSGVRSTYGWSCYCYSYELFISELEGRGYMGLQAVGAAFRVKDQVYVAETQSLWLLVSLNRGGQTVREIWKYDIDTHEREILNGDLGLPRWDGSSELWYRMVPHWRAASEQFVLKYEILDPRSGRHIESGEYPLGPEATPYDPTPGLGAASGVHGLTAVTRASADVADQEGAAFAFVSTHMAWLPFTA